MAAFLTDEGMEMLHRAAPDHVTEVRRLVFDALTPVQVDQLKEISRALMTRVSPEGARTIQQVIDEGY